LVTEIEVKQTMAIFRGALSIDVIRVSLVSEMENVYSGTLAVELKAITPTRKKSNFTPSKPNEEHQAISSDFKSYGFVFEMTLKRPKSSILNVRYE
jgi:hypothetical protein